MHVFEQAGIGKKHVSQLTGVTRRSIWRWGLAPGEGYAEPSPESLDKMSILAYSCMRALNAKALPTPKKTLEAVMAALHDTSNPLPRLGDCTPEQLQTAKWLKK